MTTGLWRFIYLFLLVNLVAAAPAVADAATEAAELPATGVPEYSPDALKDAKGTYFVKFYSPMCGHCRAFAPKWDGAYADMGGASSPGFGWASVNCIVYSDFCGEENIRGYPTLRVYRNGKRLYDYSNSGPSQVDLRSFAKAYIDDGDAALTQEKELAPREIAQLEQASQQEAKAAQEAETKQKEELGVMKSEQEKAEKAEAERARIIAENGGQSVDNEAAGQQLEQATGSTDRESVEKTADAAPFEGSSQVTALHAADFGPDNLIGRWFVLFTGPNCDGCHSLANKWEKHENFARDIEGINWGRVDCTAEPALCASQEVTLPAMWIYQDGVVAYKYEGDRDSMSLRNFLLRAAITPHFDGFSLSDIDAAADANANPDTQLGGASPNQEPNYLTGPAVSRPKYDGTKPRIEDVVKYTLDTLGQPIDEDPGKLIFTGSPESHHNFRTWEAPHAAPPPYLGSGVQITHADGSVHEFSEEEFQKVVVGEAEPWLIKFYSPYCPHCQHMAAAYADVALLTKGKLNVGAVNCETQAKLCNSQNITGWPTIALYHGSETFDEYKGPRTASDIIAYSETIYEAQIHPIENEEELSKEIIINLDKNLTTFIYLYDASVMHEDWDSLAKVATNIYKWGGKLYRSDNANLRDLAGIKHRGSAFVNVDYMGTPGEGKLKWHDFPWSNIPKKIRDADEVSKWALRAKWSLVQYLDPKAQTQFSPYIAVLLTDGQQPPSKDPNLTVHHKLALELLDYYIERQIEDQDRLRIDRLRQHDKALVENKFQYARQLMRQPIESPVRVDLAFAHIPLERWVADYGKYLDITRHEVGHVVVVDFYNGVFVDQFNLVPIRDNRVVLDDVAELLRRYQVKDPKTIFKSIRHFKKSLSGIPKPEHRPMHFHSVPMINGTGSSIFGPVPTFVKIALVIGVVYVLYVKVLRLKLRAFANRQRARKAQS